MHKSSVQETTGLNRGQGCRLRIWRDRFVNAGTQFTHRIYPFFICGRFATKQNDCL